MSRGDRSSLDEVESREVLVEVHVALALQALLVGTLAARRAVAVAAVEAVDDLHAGSHFTERREATLVEVRVVAIVDEDLRRPGIRSAGGERDEAAPVALLHRI